MPGDGRAAQGRKRRWKGKNGGRRGKTALEGEKRQDGKRRREREKRCREGRNGVRRAAQAAFWGKALFRGRMGDAQAGKAGARQQAEGPGSRPCRKRRKVEGARAAERRERRWKGKNGGRRGKKTALEGKKWRRQGRTGCFSGGKALFPEQNARDARAGKAGARQQAEGPGSRPYRKRRKAQHGGCAGVGKAAPRRVAAGAEKEKPRVCGV